MPSLRQFEATQGKVAVTVKIDPRNRLCQEILGGRLFEDQRGSALISIPISHDEITEAVLLSAQEAIYSFSPRHIRQVLPLILDAIHCNRKNLFASGYLDSFLLHVNYDFCVPYDALNESLAKYKEEYRQNWVAETLSGMNRFEHGWAYSWIIEILQESEEDARMQFGEDLKMLARLLAMALGKPESECPIFPTNATSTGN